MAYEIIKAYQENDALRGSFNRLAEETFGLSFEGWFRNGFWGDKYIPYSVVEDGNVLANVSVNIMDFALEGEKRHYIQLGTVMTRKEYRGLGLCRRLMELICRDYAEADGIFLWANDTVLDFYPKFGFERQEEYRMGGAFHGSDRVEAVHVPMENSGDWAYFLEEKDRRESLAVMEQDNDGLLMFYLSQFRKEDVYYLPGLDAYAVAELCGGVLTLYAVYLPATVKDAGRLRLTAYPPVMEAVCRAFGPEVTRVDLAFPAERTEGFSASLYTEEDTTFFIRGERLKRDMDRIGSFAALTHA